MSLTTTQIPLLEIASDQDYVATPYFRCDAGAEFTSTVDVTGGTFLSWNTTGGSLDSATLTAESLSVTSVSGDSACLTFQSSTGSTFNWWNDGATL